MSWLYPKDMRFLTVSNCSSGKTMQQQGSLDDDGGNCTEHSDCSFFDCQGECDKIAGKCRNEVANNNLQVNEIKRY